MFICGHSPKAYLNWRCFYVGISIFIFGGLFTTLAYCNSVFCSYVENKSQLPFKQSKDERTMLASSEQKQVDDCDPERGYRRENFGKHS